ncbi:MAG TPA: hypothetical protein PK569_20010 [Thermoanaerobaculia bacterium]|nr:hypothetical protein [Thermoanaerobaculia bacterium]
MSADRWVIRAEVLRDVDGQRRKDEEDVREGGLEDLSVGDMVHRLAADVGGLASTWLRTTEMEQGFDPALVSKDRDGLSEELRQDLYHDAIVAAATAVELAERLYRIYER